MIYFFNKNTMSAFQLFENILPDDIVELIYTKIVYENPKNLLDQIKYYHKILKYINIFKNTCILQKQYFFQDILTVYYSVKKQKKKSSYVMYNVNSVPNAMWNDLCIKIENDSNPNNKLNIICIKYMLDIPYCHLKYIFKRNRAII